MTRGTPREPCLLPWDSEFFALRIARAWPPLDAAAAARAAAWADAHDVACTYLLVPAADVDSIRHAEDAGFRYVDARVTLEIDPRRAVPAPAPLVRPLRPDDVASLREIASQAHDGTRFAVDRRFPGSRVRDLYATWIAQSCAGQADAVLVADRGDGAAGYVTCHLDGDAAGRIGLVGIAGSSRREGLGGQLVNAALAWFHDRAERVVVVTQGRNVGALALYAGCGFRPVSFEVWLHRWAAPAVDGGAT